MSLLKGPLFVLLLGALSLACGDDPKFGDVQIELCPGLVDRATSVEVIVARPEGFAMPLPEGTALEEFDGPSPEELVWQVPEPWGDSVEIHLGQLVGTERVAARVRFAGGNAASLLQPMTGGLSLPVCDTDLDAGVIDAGTTDASSDANPLGDGGLDADAGILQNDIRITSTGVGDSTLPSIVSAGSGLGVAWTDTRDGNEEIYFARLNSDGTANGAPVRVTNDLNKSMAPDLVWNGSEFAVAWHDDRDGNDEIYFARISSSGVIQNSPTRITDSVGVSAYPSLVADASGYAVAWEDNRDGFMQVYFTRIDAAGAEIDDEVRITATTTAALAVSMAWTGTIYGLAWQDTRDDTAHEIYFATLDNAGAQNLVDQRVTTASGLSLIPSLVWDGAGFAVAWEDGRDGLIRAYFAQLSTLGVKAAAEIPLSGSNSIGRSVDLATRASGYAATWSQSQGGQSEIHYAEISSAGVLSGASVPLTDTGAGAFEPSLTRLNSEMKVIWEDRRESVSELFFQESAP